MDDSEIKARIKAIREAQGLSQEEMAFHLGIARNTYANIEKPGISAIVREDLGKIASILRVSEEELLLGYVPCHPGDENSLEDVKARYLGDREAERQNYEARLADKEQVIQAHAATIQSLNKRIEDLELQISMMKKRKKS